MIRQIASSEEMIAAIRERGVLPLFRCPVEGWSIQDLTAKGCWFDENGADGILGPWDWKVDAVREGDLAFGKFIGGKAAFATLEWYSELVNWRRSLPKYRVALGEDYDARTAADRLMQQLAPVAYDAIRDAGALESREIRLICSEKVMPVKKNVVDSLMQYLQMGTWSVVGDIERVHRGPNLVYNGWQRASNTTPEALFGLFDRKEPASEAPSWQRLFEAAASGAPQPGPQPFCGGRTPEESREKLIQHISSLYPNADRRILLKLI